MMTQNRLLILAGILIVLTCAVLIFILCKYGKTKLHKIWALFNFAVGWWGVGCILIALSNKENAPLSWKIALTGGFSISVFFYHTVIIFTEKRKDYSLYVGYLYLIFSLLTTHLFLGNQNFAIIEKIFGSLYYLRSTSFVFDFNLIAWITIVILGHIKLLSFVKTVQGEKRNKALYFLLGMSVGFLGGAMNLLPIFNIDIYPYGNLTIPLYCAIVTYAFLKHNLADINIVIKKGIIYSTLTIIITLVYLLAILIFEKMFQNFLGYKSLLVSILASLLIAIFFVPLKNRIQYLVDRLFFNGTQLEIAQQNELLRQEVAQTEKLKTISTLASGMAHEIKNPLTVIKTFTEYFPDKKNDPKFLNKFSRLINKEVNRIDGLVHQLLEFAKPAPLEIREIKIHPLMNNILDFLNNKFVESKIHVVKKFQSPDNITLTADPNKLRQAFLNLFLNAIEAMDKGGTLTVKTRIKELEGQRIKGGKDQKIQDSNPSDPLILQSSNPIFEIIISNTGCGIAPNDLPHIFDPFFTKKDQGTGLGLSITHGIINEHGGTIRVASTAERGTNFIIELPAKSCPSQPTPPRRGRPAD